MKDSKRPVRGSSVGRRDFIKVGAGAAAAMTTAAMMTALNADTASAQSPQKLPGIPWWEAKPPKSGGVKPVCIDMHAHWAPTAYAKAVADLGHPLPDANSTNNDRIKPIDYDMALRRQWMDAHGVQMHVLTLPGTMPWNFASGNNAARIAQIINDAGMEAHKAYPDRFVLAAQLPPRDPDLALKELNRVAGKPGVRAVQLPDCLEQHDFVFERNFAPVLARIEALGYPLLFHQMGGEVNNFGKRPAGPGLDAAFMHTVLATKFITSGTLDKFPKLDVVLAHAGGAFPYLAARSDHFLNHMSNPEVKLPRPYREYLRRFHYDYLTYYPEGLRFLISLVGSDRIVVGTDSFAANDIQYPADVVDELELPAADRERMLRGNAMRLLRL
jgi:aminocarboxymuconate-semialdehyde decarboxylase